MAGAEPWVDAMKGIPVPFLFLFPFLFCRCGGPSPEPSVWIPLAAIDGPLRPEVGPPPAPRPPPERLRFASYNVHFGEDVDGIAQALKRNPALASADVLLLQEIESYPHEGRSRSARLSERLGMTWVYAPARQADAGGTHGNAILARFPLGNGAVMRLPAMLRPRIALAVDLRTRPDTVLRVIDLHLDTRLNIPDRLTQLRPAVIDAPPAAVIGGDLNTNRYVWAASGGPLVPVDAVSGTDQAPILDEFMRALGFATPTSELGATMRVLGFEQRLDSLYTRGLSAEPGAVERGVEASDHWPLWIDVTAPQGP